MCMAPPFSYFPNFFRWFIHFQFCGSGRLLIHELETGPIWREEGKYWTQKVMRGTDNKLFHQIVTIIGFWDMPLKLYPVLEMGLKNWSGKKEMKFVGPAGDNATVAAEGRSYKLNRI